MYRMYGLDLLRYLVVIILSYCIGLYAFNGHAFLQQYLFVLNASYVIIIFISGYLLVYNTDTFEKQDSVNYAITKVKQVIPFYFIATTLTFIVAFILNISSFDLYGDPVDFNFTSIFRNLLIIVDIQNKTFIYPIITHSWVIVADMAILYIIFFYLIFKENSRYRKLGHLYRDILILISITSIITLLGFNQFATLDWYILPDLIRGIFFLVFNDGFLLLPFAIGIIVALITKHKVYYNIPQGFKIIIAIVLILISFFTISQSYYLFINNKTEFVSQINGSPIIFWLLPYFIPLVLGFILLEGVFSRIFYNRNNIVRIAYLIYLFSTVIITYSIYILSRSSFVADSVQVQLIVITILMIILHLISYVTFTAFDKFLFSNKFFKLLNGEEIDQ